MSWEEKNEKQEKTPVKPEMSAFKKNLIAGAICFAAGGFCVGAVTSKIIIDKSANNTRLYQQIREERQKVKEAEKNVKTVYVTVPFYVTESIETTKETAPVTEIPETESTVPVSATETVNEISEDDVRALINPLTKKAAAPYQYTRTADWKDYWIEVKRSDLYGLKPDDFKFFNDYINEKFSIEGSFYVFVTDVPDLCLRFSVTKNEYLRSLGESFAGIDQKTSTPYHPYLDIGSCAVRFNDADQFEIQGLCKDDYGLEQYDDNKIYHYSELNDDMFAKLSELQDDARKLWG